jgi:hypothetical protein
VFEAYNTINEEDKVTVGSFDPLKKTLGGGLSFNKTENERFKLTIDRLNMLNPSKTVAEEVLERAEGITERINQSSEGVKISSAGITQAATVKNKYGWLVNGTCRVQNDISSDVSDPGADTPGYNGTDTTTVAVAPIAAVLKKLFAHNLDTANKLLSRPKKELKSDSNFGTKGKGKGKAGYVFYTIDEDSLKGDVIQIIEFKDDVPGTPTGEYGFGFPVYTIAEDPEGGLAIETGTNEISKDIYDVVLPPDPTATVVTVENKPYKSSGVDFFEENEVKIGEDGMAALRAILSEFNTISKIVVNGGASSKPTSRPGGNEKLAKDRRAAGIAALNQMKKDEVTQLAKATITEGEAKVQAAAPSESDPKNQQVSFIISGTIKKMVESPDPTPVVIKKVDSKMAMVVTFKKQYLYCSYNIS